MPKSCHLSRCSTPVCTIYPSVSLTLKNFWHNVSLSDVELVPEALLRNVCGNCFHPDLISSALGSNDVLKSWVRGEVEGSVKHVMNQTEAYTVLLSFAIKLRRKPRSDDTANYNWIKLSSLMNH